MLNIKKVSPRQINLTLSDRIDAIAMKSGLDELLEMSTDMIGGRILYTIEDFQWPTPGAILVEFQYIPRLITLLPRFDKCAVLSNIEWIKTAARMEGMLLPGLTIETFALNDEAVAQNWLDEASNPASPTGA